MLRLKIQKLEPDIFGSMQYSSKNYKLHCAVTVKYGGLPISSLTVEYELVDDVI